MTRILIVSKFKVFQGGVERHIYDLITALNQRGHQVEFFSSEDLDDDGGPKFSATASGSGRVRSVEALLWNSTARCGIERVIRTFKPELIHYHSIYHHLSPSVLGVADIPAVMTLHDYKLAAPCYSLYRDGDVCQKCVGKFVATPSVKYRCVSDSVAASALCAIEGVLYRKRYQSKIDRFIVPSQFAYDVATRGGLPSGRISIVPWGVQTPERNSSRRRRANVAFYGGRLHSNKGIGVVLDAWRTLPHGHGCELRIAGEGELEGLVTEVASADDSVQFLGMLDSGEMADEMSAAGVAIMPSLVPETMGLFAIEALVAGTPLIVSQRGALADFSGEGVWTLPRIDALAIRDAFVSLLMDGQVLNYAEDLAARDLSPYDAGRMVNSIEEEYGRAVIEHR